MGLELSCRERSYCVFLPRSYPPGSLFCAVACYPGCMPTKYTIVGVALTPTSVGAQLNLFRFQPHFCMWVPTKPAAPGTGPVCLSCRNASGWLTCPLGAIITVNSINPWKPHICMWCRSTRIWLRFQPHLHVWATHPRACSSRAMPIVNLGSHTKSSPQVCPQKPEF